MATKKATKKPLPNLQGATAEILNRVADWMELPSAPDMVLFSGTHSKEEWAVLLEAKKLAVNYVRLGARQ